MAIKRFTHEISKAQILKRIESFAYKLQNRQILGSHATGSETIKLLREVIASAKFTSFDQLCGHLVEVGDFLSEMAPRVTSFLQAAAKNKRKFTVIISETAPHFTGRKLSKKLTNSSPKIPNIVISDGSTFGLISRCTKLIIGCHIVFADGSILAKSGSLGLALAAKVHNVPVVVICGMFKFAPVYLSAGDEWSTLDINTPDEVLAVDELQEPQAHSSQLFKSSNQPTPAPIEVINPYYDHVPANLISLFITNLGGHPSSLVYRLLKDLYGA
ncbi:hypothetical protein PtA15_12A522 [Puccinia triticina]|uniref:Translation initiation factor eIF2B subunit beta n=1 Tax=Puccinia triticina TaxID=208348 RepID=A0ABY7D1G1_9BASI|nr:uncharacterized protein PtA15_12A522 [Puccinia triticina]WAQ90532.1 hypothetical protein PtA15_12A522 [Puccinia triticina]WAR61849.1 hypothetical protein PtB15_12B541 [Puccinia triticina]